MTCTVRNINTFVNIMVNNLLKVLIVNYSAKWIIYLNDKLYHKLVLVVLMIKLISEIEY